MSFPPQTSNSFSALTALAACEVVTTGQLTQWMLLAGQELATCLRDSPPTDLSVQGCLWSYDASKEQWKFIVLVPSVKHLGLRQAYRALHCYLDSLCNLSYRISWQDIMAAPTTEKETAHVYWEERGAG